MTTKLKKNMGAILSSKRKANNMTLRELAKVLNVSSQQITKYEKGVDNISSTRLWEIAEFFECSILDFFPSNK